MELSCIRANVVAISHMWLVIIWNVASASKKLNF